MRPTTPQVRRCRQLLWSVSLLFGLAVAPLAGQSGTGDIEGSITDNSGAALPGVTVTAKSPALQVPEVTVISEGGGAYHLRNLPAGVYEVRFSLSGFRPIVRQDLRLTTGFVASVNIEMAVGGVEESIVVVGASPVVDVKTTASQTTFTQELLNTAPLTRTMWQVLGMTPGVRLGSLDIGGNTTGSQTSYTSYGQGGAGATMMDGFDTSHDGAGVSAFYLDYGAFEEVQVKALGAGADVPNAGTTFQGIVKSGGNQFHGRYVFAGQSEGMTGDNLDAALIAQGVRNGDKLKKLLRRVGRFGRPDHPEQVVVLRELFPPVDPEGPARILPIAGPGPHLRHRGRRAGISAELQRELDGEGVLPAVIADEDRRIVFGAVQT